MTLLELQEILGQRIKIAVDNTLSTAERMEEAEISRAVASLAKQKYAIKTACHNFPDIIQLGDAFHARNHNWLSDRSRLIMENSAKGALDWKN